MLFRWFRRGVTKEAIGQITTGMVMPFKNDLSDLIGWRATSRFKILSREASLGHRPRP